MRHLNLTVIGALFLMAQPADSQKRSVVTPNSPEPKLVDPASCKRATFKNALDIGHDRTRSGATSARGVAEFSYNLALGRLAQSAPKTAGFSETFLINEEGAKILLSRRPEIAREQGAAIQRTRSASWRQDAGLALRSRRHCKPQRKAILPRQGHTTRKLRPR